MLNEQIIKDNVNVKFNDILLNNKEFQSFYNKLKNIGDLFLVGGAVRDLTFSTEPKDFDFITNTTNYELENILKNYNINRNRFNGYKIELDNIKIDIWLLKEHWAFKENLYDCKYENISKGAFFNYDAITLKLDNQWLDADSFIKSYETKVLDLNSSEEVSYKNPTPYKNIERAIKLRNYFHFQFSERLLEYCEFYLESNSEYISNKSVKLAKQII